MLRFNPAAGRVAGTWGEHFKLLLCQGYLYNLYFKFYSYDQALPLRQHQCPRVARLEPPWRSSPEPAVIISHPSVPWTSTHGGCHHLPGSANSQRLAFRTRVLHSGYLPTSLYMSSIHGGSSYGGSFFPSLNHGGLNGDRTSRGTGPFVTYSHTV